MSTPLGPGDKSIFGSAWIKKATANRGGLHRSLGIPQGQKIPNSKIIKAEHSSNSRERKQANLAETLKKLHKG